MVGASGAGVTSAEQRFMAKVAMIPEAGCWIWTAADNATGYGRFGMG